MRNPIHVLKSLEEKASVSNYNMKDYIATYTIQSSISLHMRTLRNRRGA